mgnify:CR=1 FL=1
MPRFVLSSCVALAVVAGTPAPVRAQDGASPWTFMYEGALLATFNHQGGPRGGDQFLSTNWLMGMAERRAGPGKLTLTGMISLDPATATGAGYREIFQAGEAYRGKPIADRQHPHDFLMQAAASWRIPVGGGTSITFTGAPVGEPALGPVAFMHRASAGDNPAAPLSHHTLDSTHIAMEVLTAGIDRGPWAVESSIFRGREPDDKRWDLVDRGPLDSWSARVWFQPSSRLQIQASHGFLKSPEEFEPGDVRRTTASLSWWRNHAGGYTALTAAYGRNDKADGAFNAFLVEATSRRGDLSIYSRLENLQVEAALLAGLSEADHSAVRLTAFTAGAVREISHWKQFDIGLGADLTAYRVPEALQPSHGSRPLSFHAFLRIRPPAGHMGRMWDMRMGRPLM